MKKALSILLVAVLFVTAMPLGAFEFKVSAATSGTTGDCNWTLDGTVLTISGNGAMASSYEEGKPWNSNLTEVIIENGVTTIGNFAFSYCRSLTSITIPDSVTSIGYGAFYYCTSLTSITIPDSVTSIGSSAFEDCTSLTSITIPDSVTSIGSGAFYNCTSLTSITIPDSVTSIGSYAFSYCTSLTSVFYRASQEDKEKITIDSSNSYLTNATWYYNSCIGSAEHTYDNTCDTTCNVCDAMREITHTYELMYDETNHYDECTVCGDKINAEEHSFDNACDTTCNVCNAKRKVGAHKYDDTCDTNCNICNAKRNVTHNYKLYTTAATLSRDGKVVKKCSVCGRISSQRVVKRVKSVVLTTTAYAYNGTIRTPGVKVTDSAGKKIATRFYTISYAKGRKNVGTYKVTVRFKGEYSGSKTLTFTIKPSVKASVSLLTGATSKIGAKSNGKITYSSSNKKVATVSSAGVITAVKAGTAIITVKSGSVSHKITAKIVNPTVKVSAARTAMYTGESQKITAITNPANAKVVWSVSNKKIAKISSAGRLTALGYGTVTVTAKIKYKGKEYKKSCKIKINVEYPDVSVFISSKIDYTNQYAVLITNEGKRPIKVLSSGYVYCNGESAFVNHLFIMEGYKKTVSISGGDSKAIALCLDKKIIFLKSKPVFAYVYIEYGGQTFRLWCDSSAYGLNRCKSITWIK